MSGFSKETQALLAAARGDGPAGTTRDAMWSKLEVSMGLLPAGAASTIRVAESAPSAPPAPPSAPPPAPAGLVKSSAVLKVNPKWLDLNCVPFPTGLPNLEFSRILHGLCV